MRRALLAAALGMIAGGGGIALARDTQGERELQEVLVTVRKRSEPVARVPLAVSAVSHSQLERSSVEGLQTLAQLDPGLYFESMWGGGNAAPVLRAQAQPSAAGDNVGVFVDGVYQATRANIDVELLDLERIELVHGPQSALYGRSTFAGAINYVSRKPVAQRSWGGSAEAANGNARLLQGWLGGALGLGWNGRIAASTRAFDGTARNNASGGARFGGLRRDALVLQLRREAPVGDWTIDLAARLQRGRGAQPAFISVPVTSYNCGSRNPASGLWSYFCGEFPRTNPLDLSADIPDSSSDVSQLRVELARDFGRWSLTSESSYYRGSSNIYRDFDGSSAGQLFAATTVGPARLVTHLLTANIVQAARQTDREFAQELRITTSWSSSATLAVGAYYSSLRNRSDAAFGVARGTLAANEQLASLLPATPFVAGPVSPFNRLVVADPTQSQVPQSLSFSTERNIAVFTSWDYPLRHDLLLHGEMRYAWQRQALDSQLANGGPSFGTAIAPQEFHDLTPRLSLQWLATEQTQLYASAAKGSRSGGINLIPDLPADEQTFDPEFNWTYELGLRTATADQGLRVALTAFEIDWHNTQITGLSNSPLISNLITTNTAGLLTRGIEGSVDLRLHRHLSAGLAFSRQRARFTNGSDDPAGRGFCGITAQILTSSFCVIGPPRSGVSGGIPVVPYIDGNWPGRAPAFSWNLHADANFPLPGGSALWLRTDLSHQGKVYERPNDGAWYGERTLANLRLGFTQRQWSLELWGRNLTNQQYIKAAASRGAAFFSTTPRPLDLLYGEERRYGVTLRFEH